MQQGTPEDPDFQLDLMETYIVDGEKRTISRAKIEKVVENPMQPTLRFLKDGRILLDDEVTAPSWHQVSGAPQ